MMSGFWLTPKELYDSLNEEFEFDFDPCPYPKPDWDGLKKEWGEVNWVNPPFLSKDGGPATLWLQKSIGECGKGKTVVMILSVYSMDKGFWKLLIDSKIKYQLRYINTGFLHTKTGAVNRKVDCLIFIMEGKFSGREE